MPNTVNHLSPRLPLHRALADAAVLTVAVGVATIPIFPAFGALIAAPAVVMGLSTGTLLALTAAWGRWTAGWVLAAALTLIEIIGAAVIGAPRWLGVIPTGAGITEVARGAIVTWKEVVTLVPPIGTVGPTLLAPFILAFSGALLATTIALRVRRPYTMTAAAVPVVVLVISNLLGTAHALVPPALVGAVLFTGLLLWTTARAGTAARHRPAVTATLLVVALVGAIAGAPAAVLGRDRFVLRDYIVPPFDPADYPSPLAAYRSFVKLDDEVLFTVNGELPAAARIRLATFDRYNGTVWNVAGSGAAQGSGEYRRLGAWMEDSSAQNAAADTAELTVTIAGLTGVWLPTLGAAAGFTAERDLLSQFRYNDATGGAVLTSGVYPGMTYTENAMVTDTPTTAADVGAAGSADVVLPSDTGVPGAVGSQAQTITRQTRTALAQVQALADWLQKTGYYSDGLEGSYPCLPGHGAARMTSLLGDTPMVGDSEQYASALALLARSLHLKARVVLGFVPGIGKADSAESAVPQVQDGQVEIHGNDVQAWVEVAFAGVGWVTFDATPPRSQTVTDEQEDSPADPRPQVLQPPDPPSDPPQQSEDDHRQPQTDGAPPAVRPHWVTVLIWAGAGLGGLSMLLLPLVMVLILKWRRARRRRAGVGAHAVAGGWAEIVDAAVDLRQPVLPVSTRSEVAAEVGKRFDPDGVLLVHQRLADLAHRADRGVFAPRAPNNHEVDMYWKDVQEALAGIRRGVRWRQRIGARLSLRSLRRRGTERQVPQEVR